MRAIVSGAAVAALALSATVVAQRPAAPASSDFEVLPVQGHVWAIFTPTSNVVVQAGPNGAVIVDTATAAVTDRILAEVKKLTDQPIRMIINTSVDTDHVGGNDVVSKSGAPLPGTQTTEVPIVGHQNGAARLAKQAVNPLPLAFWPSNTFFGEKKTLHVNGEAIEIIHVPAAHSDADVMVHFRRSDVLATGDVFSTQTYPAFSPETGGSIQGVLDALNRIIDITVPEINQQGGTLVVPGHGRIANESEVVDYRDMATIVRDRVKTMVDAGRTLEQIKAARPTLEYDGLYGSGAVTGAAFIEAVYRDVSRRAAR